MTQQRPDADIDYWRQLDIFSPEKFNIPITIIGAGATGSYVALLLAKMGCRRITVYDFDVVENYNLPNQIYRPSDTGRKKVEALADIILEQTGVKISAIPERFERGKLEGIVFVLTDTMKSRAQIWSESVQWQLTVTLLVETRMAAEGGYVYAVNPTNPLHVEEYAKTLYTDEEAEESVCTNRAIAPTVATIAGIASFMVVHAARGKVIPNQTLVNLSPPFIQTKNFN